MATWSLLLGAVLNLVALLLFGVAYRSPSLAQVRRLERGALLCGVAASAVVGTEVALLVLSLQGAGNAGIAFGLADLGLLALPLIPFTAWLGILLIRRSRAAS